VVPPISVSFDMTFANRNQGGSGAYARSLLASLHERNEVDTSVISGPERSNFAGTIRWLVRGGHDAIAAHPPDLLHCPSFVAPWAISVPFVVTVHDTASKHFPGDHPLEWRVYVDRFMPGRLRAAARVITGSEFGRHEVIDAFGLDADRVVAVPYGLDSRFLDYIPTEPAPTGGPLLFPGAPIGRKNLGAVLRCMAAAKPASFLGRVNLQISGAREEDFPGHARLVRTLGLESRVQWLGQVPSADMLSLFGRAAALVYPSLYEGFGFPPLEAMAVGTPVVASDRGSLPEVLGDAALTVDPTDDRALGDALEAVLSQPDLRSRLRSAGLRQARLYTWDKCAQRTAQVYREVLATAAVPS
jgi:glycosyltransferase involved in cell wall biosynthesis